MVRIIRIIPFVSLCATQAPEYKLIITGIPGHLPGCQAPITETFNSPANRTKRLKEILLHAQVDNRYRPIYDTTRYIYGEMIFKSTHDLPVPDEEEMIINRIKLTLFDYPKFVARDGYKLVCVSNQDFFIKFNQQDLPADGTELSTDQVLALCGDREFFTSATNACHVGLSEALLCNLAHTTIFIKVESELRRFSYMNNSDFSKLVLNHYGAVLSSRIGPRFTDQECNVLEELGIL